MMQAIETMLRDFESGKLTRRHLALSLATMVASAQTPAKEKGFRAVTINHVTVKVPDLQRTSRFYQELFEMPLKQHSASTHILGVGNSFFGIEQGDEHARVDHYDFGIAAFDADRLRARLRKLSLKIQEGNSQESFKFFDPDGLQIQVNAPDYVGHVS
ncbi:MAG TPA: VOC family protein [Bryobacteraceae bacterium]|nr:VOC family protein [Bryobacteraceae bacterium]